MTFIDAPVNARRDGTVETQEVARERAKEKFSRNSRGMPRK
jgi:hypothetical protein